MTDEEYQEIKNNYYNKQRQFEIQPRRERPELTKEEMLADFRQRMKKAKEA